MSSNVFDADNTPTRAVPWRENRQPRKEVAREPRKAVFGEAPPNRTQPTASSDTREEQLRESWQQGFQAGEAAARQKLEHDVRSRTEQLARTIAEIAGLRCETIYRAESDLVRLSIEIARRILHRELAADSSALESLIKAALEKLNHQEVYRVRVCPGEEQVMHSCLQQTGRGQAIEVVSDASQSRGGAFFEISRGALDASVDTQLAEIERGLLDEMQLRAPV